MSVCIHDWDNECCNCRRSCLNYSESEEERGEREAFEEWMEESEIIGG